MRLEEKTKQETEEVEDEVKLVMNGKNDAAPPKFLATSALSSILQGNFQPLF